MIGKKAFSNLLIFLCDRNIFSGRFEIPVDDCAEDLLVDGEGHPEQVCVADLVLLQPHQRLVKLAVQRLDVAQRNGSGSLKLKQEPSSILLFFRIFLSTKNNFRRSDNLHNYFLFLLLLLKNVSLTNICLIMWRNYCSIYYKKKLFLSIRVLTPELKENPSL